MFSNRLQPDPSRALSDPQRPCGDAPVHKFRNRNRLAYHSRNSSEPRPTPWQCVCAQNAPIPQVGFDITIMYKPEEEDTLRMATCTAPVVAMDEPARLQPVGPGLRLTGRGSWEDAVSSKS